MGTTLQLAFADWTFRNGNVVMGTLDGASVRLSGRLGTVVLDGSNPEFSSPVFTPPLPASDLIEVVSTPDNNEFTVDFGGAVVQDPVFHLGSLGSILTFTFPVDTLVTRLSGDDEEADGGPRDFKVGGSGVDGVSLQIGGKRS